MGKRKSDAVGKGLSAGRAAAVKAERQSEDRVAPLHHRGVRRPPPLAPLERRLKQKLSRGREEPDARIDLHGMTQADAHAALAHFLRRAQHDGARVVLVITGKGARVAGADPYAERGVLKRQVPLWLESAELRALRGRVRERRHRARRRGGAVCAGEKGR